jgi:hypothetical protein
MVSGGDVVETEWVQESEMVAIIDKECDVWDVEQVWEATTDQSRHWNYAPS